MSEVRYRPSEWQQRFHDNDCDELLGAGAAGPGKTLCLIFEGIYIAQIEHARCTRDPDSVAERGSKLWHLVNDNPIAPGESVAHVLYLRRTNPRLFQTVSRTRVLFPKIDSGAEWRAGDNMWVFSSGMIYQFGHCHDRNDWDQYQGGEYIRILYDELTEFEEEQYDQINTRKRTTDPVLRYLMKIRAMSNPVMKRHATDNFQISNPYWVRERFVDPAPQGGVLIKRKISIPGVGDEFRTMMYLRATIDDNPDKEFVRQYKFELASAKPHIRKALLEGDWYITFGAYFSDVWDPARHICRPFDVPPDWLQFRAMDWGYNHPGCVLWFAVDPDGNLYVTREMDFKGKDAAEVARDIKEIEKRIGLWKGGRSRITGPADTQLWEERGDVSKSKATEMSEVGVRWTHANKRSRARNGMLVSTKLRADEKGEPTVAIFNTCVGLIRTLPSIQTDPSDNTGEMPAKAHGDDPYDAFSYGLAFYSGNPFPPMVDADDSLFEDENRSGSREMDLGESGYGF